MPRSTTASPWARYEPTPDDPWDLRKVAHLHRRAGFGATRAELLRDLAAGPEASVERLFQPPRSAARGGRGDRRPAPDGAVVVEPRPAQGLLAQPHPPRARPAPREADPVLARPLRHQQQEGRVGRAHGPAERDAADARPGRVRRDARGDHRRPGHAGLARRRATARRTSPTRTSPASSSSCSPWAPGTITERDIREAARAFTGWVRQDSRGGFQETPAFAHDTAQVDDGPKTFLGLNGPLGAVGHRPDHARAPRGRDLPGAQALPMVRQRVRHAGPRADRAAGRGGQAAPVRHRADRGGHPPLAALLLPRGLSPADQVAGGVQRGPGADARGAAPGAQPAGALGRLRRAGPGAVRPAQRRGLGRRLDLDQQRHAARAHQLGRRRRLGPLRERPDARSTRWPGRPATSCPPTAPPGRSSTCCSRTTSATRPAGSRSTPAATAAPTDSARRSSASPTAPSSNLA